MNDLYNKALKIVEAYERYDDRACTCFQGNAPCSKCENCPTEDLYLEALKFVENHENF